VLEVRRTYAGPRNRPGARLSRGVRRHGNRLGLRPSRGWNISNATSRNAKRGVSDFYPVLGDLEREAKLRRNTAVGAALQAAIAWIVEVPTGMAQAATSAGPGMVTDYKGPFGAGGMKTRMHCTTRRAPSCEPDGPALQTGPMGSERNPNFVVVGQYVLPEIAARGICPNTSSRPTPATPTMPRRWSPSRLSSRPAKPTSSSTGGTSVRCSGRWCGWRGKRVVFSRLGVSWETLEALIEIKIDAPAVATRDALQMARTQEVQIGLGILSRQTAAAQAGLDYDAEVAQLNAEFGVRNAE